MGPFDWMVLSTLAMSAIAMVGAITLVLKPETLDRLLLPLVVLAAGSLIGGAFFHRIPGALAAGQPVMFTWQPFLLEWVCYWLPECFSIQVNTHA